jgi:hypothetical protein
MLRQIFKAIFVTIGVGIIILIFGGSIIYKFLIKPIFTTPDELNTPRTVVNSDLVSKKIFVGDLQLGMVTGIVLGELDGRRGQEIGIAGRNGALFLSTTGKVKSSVRFDSPTSHVEIIDVEGDGICEFINRGGYRGNTRDASLLDHNGKTLWSYGGSPGIDNMCGGDIDGDGTAEFVAGFNGGGGVHLIDKNGEKRWRQPDGNVWHVELADTNGNGNIEIVHSNAGGGINVRDKNGNIISRARGDSYFTDFSICKWPSKNDREYVLHCEKNTIGLYDFNGEVISRFVAPDCSEYGHARGVLVKTEKGKPEYLAVLAEFRHWKRAMLYIYDSTGKLVYQDILPDACASIAAIPLKGAETDTVLVGGDGRVWEYTVGKKL